MKVKMLQTTHETGDGRSTEHFIKGETYDVRDYLGYKLIQTYFGTPPRAEVVSW